MQIEISDQPIQFRLHGFSGDVDNNRFGEVGFRLMNEMWQVVKSANIVTTGINHWVYLPDGKMFVGVELQVAPSSANSLETLEFQLKRYLRHVHIGPYQVLPQKWRDLKAELQRQGESIGSPSLEIYGHHWDDPTELETTILIALET